MLIKLINFLKKLVIFCIIITTISLYISEISTTYKFGILIENYKKNRKYGELLSKRPIYFSLNNNSNRYSWNTPLKLPNSDIELKLEHLTPVNDFDISIIPKLKNHNNFLTIVEYSSDNIISIEIENEVDGDILDPISIYAYIKSNSKNRKFDIVEIDNNNNLNIRPNRVAIGFIFPSHKNIKTDFIGIKKYKFDKAIQKMRIKYLNDNNETEEEEYIFDLKWYYHLTGWDKFITIT